VLPAAVAIPFRRAIVFGSSGAGKSTFARQLGAITGVPVTHIDQLFWSPGWVQTPTHLYLQRLEAVMAQPAWIIEGVNTSTLARRLASADVMFWIDRSRYVCLSQLMRRVAGSYGKVRADLAPGCPEHLPNLDFLKFIWHFDRDNRHRVEAAIEATKTRDRVVMLQSHRQSRVCLSAIQQRLGLAGQTTKGDNLGNRDGASLIR
jgi:adenylate kinase family enzyme